MDSRLHQMDPKTSQRDRLLGEHHASILHVPSRNVAPNMEEKAKSHIQQPTTNHSRKRLAWSRLYIMVGLLVLAVVLAVGHHFYYTYLNLSPAGAITRQQWALRIGTAFWFLIILLLKTAVGIAYVQLLWLVLRRKPFRVRDIDALFALGTSDITAFASTGIWNTAMMAVPVAAIIM